MKPERIGRIKSKHQPEAPKKKVICIRCGETWTKTHMEKCPAKYKICNICKKEDKVCKTSKAKEKAYKKSHFRRIEAEASEDSKEQDEESSGTFSSQIETDSEIDSDEISASDNQAQERKSKHKRGIKCKRAKIAKITPRSEMSKQMIGEITGVEPKSNDTVELKMTLTSNKPK